MKSKYLMRVYKDNKLSHWTIVEFPTDVGHWIESSKKDRRDGFETSYRSIQSPMGVSRIVVTCRAVHKESKTLYLYNLLDYGRGKELLKSFTKDKK